MFGLFSANAAYLWTGGRSIIIFFFHFLPFEKKKNERERERKKEREREREREREKREKNPSFLFISLLFSVYRSHVASTHDVHVGQHRRGLCEGRKEIINNISSKHLLSFLLVVVSLPR